MEKNKAKKTLGQDAKKIRSSMTKKIRFEVFKRDSFKCQYCGKSAPEVILHVDHIKPVSKGGDNDIMNLITACESCNQGKSDRELIDTSIIEKQKQQLEELNKKREQLEMMISWRDELQSFSDDVVDIIEEKINEKMSPFSINESGKKNIARWIKKFEVKEILDAIELSADIKIKGLSVTSEMAEVFFNYIPKMATVKRKPEAERKIFYVRGILKNRIYVNETHVLPLIKNWIARGGDIEELIEFSKTVRNWTEFRIAMEE